jgi:hypothetical protein
MRSAVAALVVLFGVTGGGVALAQYHPMPPVQPYAPVYQPFGFGNRLSLCGGFQFPGSVYNGYYDGWGDSDLGPMIKTTIGLSGGPSPVSIFANVGFAAIEGVDAVWTFAGLSVPLNRPSGQGLMIRTTFEIGTSIVAGEYGHTGIGLGLGLTVRFQMPGQIGRIVADIGFYGSPTGSEDHGYEFTFPPIPFICAGFSF